MVVEARLPGGETVRAVGNPIKLASAQDDPWRRPPPGMGEHTDEVLAAWRHSPEEIARLRQVGAVS